MKKELHQARKTSNFLLLPFISCIFMPQNERKYKQMNNTRPTPTAAANRIASIDVLRGFALLGILMMNMIFFSNIGAGYLNPYATGGLEGADKIAFYFSKLFADQKFISIFSMLFGAGIILMSERMEARGTSPARRHYIRNFWLLLMGFAHAYLIWAGDVLVTYAICSIWVFLFRKKSPRTLFIWAGVLMTIPVLFNLLGTGMPAEEMDKLCQTSWLPDEAAITAEIEAFRGSWFDQMQPRISHATTLQTVLLFWLTGWQVTGLMLIGMGLFKSGVLQAKRTNRYYRNMFFIGWGIALPLGVFGLVQNFAHNWECGYSFFIGSLFNYIGSLPMALGYIGLIMLVCKSPNLQGIAACLAPVGRMALTNYLLQSIIATFVFYGHGLGMFAKLSRAETWIVILGIWTFEILFSKWWMSRFKFGPMEWLWRSLTYGKLQAWR